MPSPTLIAFTGQATAGKSTAARHLVAHHPRFHRLSFADPIRQMLLALGLTSEDLSDRKHEPHPLLCGKTPRQAMQSLGTEWGRDGIGGDIWLRAMERRICAVWSQSGRVVIDDLRFDNEAILVHGIGGLVIDVWRPGLPPRMAHESERGIDRRLIDHAIQADGPAHLFACLDAFLCPAIDPRALPVAQPAIA